MPKKQWRKERSKCYSIQYILSNKENPLKGKMNHKRKTNHKKECHTKKELSLIFFHLKNRLYLIEILIKVVNQLVRVNVWNGTSYVFMVTDCLRKLFKWIKSSKLQVWENQSSETISRGKMTGRLDKLLMWNSLDEESACPWKKFCWSCFFGLNRQSKRLPSR